MKTFNLSAAVTVSAYTIVEADSIESAIKLSHDRYVAFGGTGSGADPNKEWIIEEPDGDPMDIHAELE